jgi:hypothetical protein
MKEIAIHNPVDKKLSIKAVKINLLEKLSLQ